MDKDALQFYLESKNDFSFRAEEKLAQEREEKVADTLKQVAVNFAKKNPDIATHAITGGILGGASELAMPSEIDAMGRPSTNMTQIGKRALLGATMGGIGSGVKQHVKSKIDKLAEDKEAGLKDLLKSPVGKGALIGGLAGGLPMANEAYIQQKHVNEDRSLDPHAAKMNPYAAALVGGTGGALMGAIPGAFAGKAFSNPHLTKELGGLLRPDTSSIKKFMKDKVVQDTAIGALGGAASSLGSDNRVLKNNEREFEPNIPKLLVSAGLGGAVGASHGLASKLNNQLGSISNMVDVVKNYKKWKPSGSKALPLDRAHLPIIKDLGEGVELLAKQASVGDFIYRNPRASLGLGGAALGGGVGYLGAKKKDRMGSAISGAAALGGTGLFIGSNLGAQRNANKALERAGELATKIKEFRRNKTANALSPMLQRAGSLIAKNPRAASAALGAGTGLAANAVTGSDAPVFSAVAGGALGALGGKQLLRATVNRANPLLGKDVAQGAVGVMKQNRASQLALRSPKVVNMGATEAAASNLKGMSTPSPAGPRNVPVGNAAPAYSVKAQASNPASFTPTNQPKTSLTGVSFSPSATPAPTAQKADFMSAYRPTRSTANPSMNQARAAMPQTSYSPEMAQTLSKIAEIMKW